MALRLDGLSVTKPNGLKAGESESVSLSSAVALATTVDLLLLLMVFHDIQVLGLVKNGEKGWWLRGGESRGAQARAIFLVVAVPNLEFKVEKENQRFSFTTVQTFPNQLLLVAFLGGIANLLSQMTHAL